MDKINDLLKGMQEKPNNVKFSDLCRVCDHYFGETRQKGTSHRIYKTPWAGDPRVIFKTEKEMPSFIKFDKCLRR